MKINIVEETEKLIYNVEDDYNKMAQTTNPYGDGNASKKIVEILLNN
jgi:UDP-N-acetylglucosamine 2-epimerase